MGIGRPPAPPPARPASRATLLVGVLLLASALELADVRGGGAAAALSATLGLSSAAASSSASSYSPESFPLPPGATPRLNWFAVALDGAGKEGYERFLVPYAAYSLHAQRWSVAELVVANREAFEAEHAPALRVLRRVFPGRLLVREPAAASQLLAARLAQGGWRAMVRFVEAPVMRANVTLIGDIDILTLTAHGEDVAAEHLAHMRAFSPPLPYSNVLRPHKTNHRGKNNVRFNNPRWRHVTGRLHAVETEAYYGAPEWAEALQWFTAPEAEGDPEREDMLIDEVALQNLCRRAFGLPERDNLAPEVMADASAAKRALEWTPVRGVHLSPSRGQGKAMLVVASCAHCRAAASVASLAWFRELRAASPALAAAQAQLAELCSCCSPGAPDEQECKM